MSTRSSKQSSNAANLAASKKASAPAIPKQNNKQPLVFRPRALSRHDALGRAGGGGAAAAAAAAASPGRIARYRKAALVGVGITGFLLALQIGSTVAGYKRDAKYYASLNPPVPLDVTDRWRNTRLAENFDLDVDFQEWLGGTNRLRAALCSKARGHVLEASVGTGRNTTYYPLTKDIKTITMVDTSPEMLDIARLKWAKKNAWFINAVFWVQSAGEKVALPTPEAKQQGGFDTVVQTMGVCSTPEPEQVLANFGRLCKQDEDSRILLLEHGRSHYQWLNKWIDAIAPAHADREGCWFNKDIGDIVRRSGLEIIEEKRFHFGTLWWYVLKPPSNGSEDVKDAAAGSGESHKQSVKDGRNSSSWWSLPWWK